MKRIVLFFVSLLLFVLFLLSAQTELLAYQTFNCTGGMFDKILATIDECVLYVRYEIGGNYDVCNGEAWTCHQDAIDAGYKAGQNPEIRQISYH